MKRTGLFLIALSLALALLTACQAERAASLITAMATASVGERAQGVSAGLHVELIPLEKPGQENPTQEKASQTGFTDSQARQAGDVPAEARAGDVPLAQRNAGEETTQLTLVNAGEETICYVFISPVSSESWGEDWLGAEEVIEPDMEIVFDVEPGAYDVQAMDCNGDVLDEVYDAFLEGRMEWTIETAPAVAGGNDESPEPVRDFGDQPPYPLPTPASPGAYLCCGASPGESGNIWSVSYPANWTVHLLPENPRQFYGALFEDPDGHVLVTIIPAATTLPGDALDTGDVDEWLNRFVRRREGEVEGFQEFMRQPVAGVPGGRLWAGTWGSGSDRGWEAYLVVVNPAPVVLQGMPQGYLTMFGVRADSRNWNNATQLYAQMMDSLRIKGFGGNSAGLPMREPNQKPFMVRWCPRTCDWMAVDADSEDWVGDCGEPTWLWETTCIGNGQ